MLSAFKAQLIHELKPRDKSKVESLLAYGDRLLVGLNTGVLRIYLVNEDQQQHPGLQSPSRTSPKVIELAREEEKFSKKPIVQLAIIKEANVLISLSDGYVSLHDLKSYELVERLEQTKGATSFATTSHVVKDGDSPPMLVSRLAVGVKRKIICWTWQDMEQLADPVELTMEATVKSLNWATGTILVAGMDPGFSVVDIETQQVIPVNKPSSRTSTDPAIADELAGVRFAALSSSGMGYMGMGSWVPKPMATPMTNGQVLLAKDVNTLFVDVEGKPLEKRQIPWQLAPEAIGYSYPYLLALQPPDKGTLHIRNPDTLNLLQNISVPGASILHVPQPNISLAHAGKGFIVASERTIWRMNALPYDDQMNELLGKQRFDEAISFLSLLEDTLIDDKVGRIREVKIQKAIFLFQQQKYRPALDLFTDSEAPVDRVVALYPRIISGDLCTDSESSNSDNESVSELVDTKTSEGGSVRDSNVTPTKGMFGKLVTGTRPSRDSDATSVRSSARADTDNMSIRSRVNPTKQLARTETLKSLEGDDLKMAVRCLLSFLAQARQLVQKHMETDGTLKEFPPVLDTETGKPSFANILPQSLMEGDLKNVDWQVELLKTAQLVDTTLFKSYMFASPGLAGPLFRVANFCDSDVVKASLYENDRYSDLIDFLHGKKLHREALEMLQKFGKGEADAEIPEAMRGPARTVAYLKQLPPELIETVLEFVKWPITEDPTSAMEVFLADSDNAERLPRQPVLDFLATVDVKLEADYLAHIIVELGDQEPEYHQKLIDIYLQQLKSDELNDDEKSVVQSKAESFLWKSSEYNKLKTFRQLPADNPLFYEIRAIVLSAMGNHKQALSIYVFQMQAYTKAEEYCHRIYATERNDHQPTTSQTRPTSSSARPSSDSDPETSTIFAVLLGIYLRPPPDEATRWPQALELLSKHGARLPASSTLDLMPDDLVVHQLHDYFRGRIRHATSALREERVVRGLEAVRRAAAEFRLRLGDAEIDPGHDDRARSRHSEDDHPNLAAAADEEYQPAAIARTTPSKSATTYITPNAQRGRNRRVRITEEDRCRVCHKRFGASAIRVYPDGVVVHYACVGKRPSDAGLLPSRNSSGALSGVGAGVVAGGSGGRRMMGVSGGGGGGAGW